MDALDVGQQLNDLYEEAIRQARRAGADPHLAQDAVQEAALRTWQARHKLDPGRPLRAWFLTVVTRETWRLLSKRRDVPLPAERLHDLLATEQEDPLQRWLSAHVVEERLAQLPPHLRETVRLRYLFDLTEAEVARIQGIPLGTVKHRLHRVRKLMAAAPMKLRAAA